MIAETYRHDASTVRTARHATIAALDLTVVVRSARSTPAFANLGPVDVELAEREYRRFLILAAEGRSLPMLSPAVDELWHAHILRTAEYRALCASLGVEIDHEPADGAAPIDACEAAEFRMAYADLFGEPPPEDVWTGAFRCRGKACHAPTPCRCRRINGTA